MYQLYRWRLGLLVIVVMVLLHAAKFLPRPSLAQAVPGIQLQTLLTGLSSPVLVTHAHDGSNRIFIVEQTGLIKVLQPGSTAPTAFLDLTAKRSCCGERGVLGLAFHPQYSSNRRFFVNYTRASDGATVVAEYSASPSNPNVALTAEEIILVIAQPFANHNGGMIEFGSDGFLYIGMGDGGSANDPNSRAQNRNDLLGKMLRLNIDQTNGEIPYSSPTSNPFSGTTDGRDEIYALGLRNPWRFSFDRLTRQLYAGDVGQGQREEVDLITLGGNYGWRVFEATRCTGLDPTLCNPANFVAPLFEYDHSGSRCSLTGGYVYRGARSSLPWGAYVYGDYCTGEIFMSLGGSQTLLLDTTLNISSFGEDEAGEVYVCGLGGTIYRIANPAVSAAVNVSAASFRPDLVAPGSIIASFGTGLANSTASAELPLPTALAGTQVRIRDVSGLERPAQLFFASPLQVNLLAPDALSPGRAEVRITNSRGEVSTGIVQIAVVAPGVFSANTNGSGVAAGYVTRLRPGGNQTIDQVAELQPSENRYLPAAIDLGPSNEQVILTLFLTGIRLRSSMSAVSVTVGGELQEVQFAGAQGFFAGLDQINARLSRTLIGRGEVDVIVTVDAIQANTVTIQVK
ncbi:MAG: PQQ-dependent sugar dehydrogenase [Acidobacteriota bacterium]